MQLPPVYFNHLYLVLKDSTYRAILGSDFLRTAFSGMERRTTYTSTGEWWSGAYYYGDQNYLEFFGASAGHWIGGAQEGWAGLAFSVDEPGGALAVRQAIEEACGYQPGHRLRQVQLGENTVNWFYLTQLAEQVSLESFDSWVMEYHPDIFRQKGIAYTSGSPLTRQAYLSPWNTGKHAERSKPVFNRITEITLRMAPEPAERYARILTILGYTQSVEDGVLVLSAHGTSLRFLPEKPEGMRYRVHSLRLAMLRPSVRPMTFVFAPGSRLVLGEDDYAEWFFGE